MAEKNEKGDGRSADVDDYLAAVPEQARTALEKLRGRPPRRPRDGMISLAV